MNYSPRITLTELRAKVDAYTTGVEHDARTLNPDAIVLNVNRLLNAWETAYLWHVGIHDALLRAGRAADVQAFDYERTEGTTLIREKLPL